jgi:hypothetical protein
MAPVLPRSANFGQFFFLDLRSSAGNLRQNGFCFLLSIPAILAATVWGRHFMPAVLELDNTGL